MTWALLQHQPIGPEGDPYLDRWWLVRAPWFQVAFHRIYRPDNQRDMHDHPWNFLSLVLRGWYLEKTPGGIRVCRWWNRKRAEELHSILYVSRKPIWTLVFTGRKRRQWGFWVDGGTRFVPWNEYEKLEEA